MVEGAHEKYCWKIESEDSESGESGLFGVPIRDEERVVHVPAFAADISGVLGIGSPHQLELPSSLFFRFAKIPVLNSYVSRYSIQISL